jgi:hypothetical protein
MGVRANSGQQKRPRGRRTGALNSSMPVDHIRYDILVQEALRGMVRNVLAEAAKNGLMGDHHFFVTFDTTADGVQLSDRLREQYPEEMRIVLQHQFWGMKVTDEQFEVGLSFGGVAEKLVIPYTAIKIFDDPSVQFKLQFETLAEIADEDDDESAPGEPLKTVEPKLGPKSESKRESKLEAKPRTSGRQEPARTSVPASPLPEASKTETSAETGPDGPPDTPPDRPGAEVVRLDRFRKK